MDSATAPSAGPSTDCGGLAFSVNQSWSIVAHGPYSLITDSLERRYIPVPSPFLQ